MITFNKVITIINDINILKKKVKIIFSSLNDLQSQLNQVNTTIQNLDQFKTVNYSGNKDGINNTFILDNSITDPSVSLNGNELIRNVHFVLSITGDTLTIIDNVFIPKNDDYLVVRGLY